METLGKHAYSNILKILPQKKKKKKKKKKKEIENFQIKNSYFIFHISAQNIDCECSPHRGCSNEYSQSMFLAEI